MEKRLRSSLQSSAEEFLTSATKLSLKSSKPSLKTLIHKIKPSSDLSSSLPISLSHSISHAILSFQTLLLQPNPNPNPRSPRSPPTKRPRRSSRSSKTRPDREPEPDLHPDPNPEEEKHQLLSKLQILACIAQLCAGHPANAFPPLDLLPGVQALHDNLIILESDSALVSAIANLCEQWWKEELPGRESLISQSLPFLLSRSLTLNKKADVHRVYALREAFTCFDFEDESIEDLKLLLIRCVISPLFSETEEGRKFLAFLFGLSLQLLKEVLAVIKSQIPFGRKSMLEAYGDILFRAEGELRSEIENGFLQVLGGFINQRTTAGVEKLLFQHSEPVIFRSLQVANSNVRQNALHLLLDLFPLEDPDSTKEVKDSLLDKQFFLLGKLLVDDCPEVVRALEGNLSPDELNEGVIPGQSMIYSSSESTQYSTREYKEDMLKFRKLALESQELDQGISETSGPSSDFGHHQSASSGEGQQTSQDIEHGRMDKDSQDQCFKTLKAYPRRFRESLAALRHKAHKA